jgi:ABC-type transporter MlaC component
MVKVRPFRLIATALLLTSLLTGTANAYWGESGQVPLRRSLPNAIDLMESGLYWLQDLSGVDNPRDPAAIVALMEDQAARYFDFAYMAYLIAGPRYTQLNALERSHFQNRVRDRLFASLARHFGMYDRRMPMFYPILPVRTSLYTWKGGGYFFHQGGPTVRLMFHFYLTERGWRIYDVTSNGVSAVDKLRARFHDNLFDR